MSRFLLIKIYLLTFIVACVYANDCPTECGENEICDSCGSQCELKCSNPHPHVCSFICLPPACACSKDFARDEKINKCVPKNSCLQ
ncbi:chymotrypsin inhibitor-like [Cotesia typhae]|uniref:chymotrypsin inhibitor-like n=1 Tax=Cotesia typhae TaxID=2053667 RepID=UPI003D69CD02